VDGERGLADAGAARDHDDGRTVVGTTALPRGDGVEPAQRDLAPGEAGEVGRQLGGGAAAAGTVPRRAGGHGRGVEPVALAAREAEDVGQDADGPGPRRPGAACLEIPDPADAHPGAFREVLLAHAEPPPVRPHHVPEHPPAPPRLSLWHGSGQRRERPRTPPDTCG
jgi:hypothetical protein